MTSYRDRFLSVDGQGITIRWYGFPFGDKRIRWSELRSATKKTMGPLTGQWRIWGSGDLRHWFNLDPERPSKADAFVLDIGGSWFLPVVTPDDPRAFAAQLAAHGVMIH